MKTKLFALLTITIMLIMSAGCTTEGGIQINTPVANAQASTPGASGQVTIPGVSIQFNAPGPNPLVNTPAGNNRISGILTGIWHGVISPVTLVISFINPNVQMYEVHNDGGPYNLGFLLGIAIVFLLLGAGLGSRRRK
jgi:hypothetical protein